MEKITRTWRRSLSFRGFSIQQRLPLLICILLLGIMTTFGIISYISVRQAAEKSGWQKLNTAADQLGNILGQSTQVMLKASSDAAASPEIKQYLKDNSGQDLVSHIMMKLERDTQSVLVDLVDADLNPKWRVEKANLRGKIDFRQFKPRGTGIDTPRIGKLQQIGDSLYYPIIAAVKEGETVLGYILRWRILYNNPRAIKQLSQLMGGDARIAIGNADNSAWTDMSHPIPNPLPTNARPGNDGYRFVNSSGENVIASVRPVRQTPWMVMITFSSRTIMEPARQFLKWVLIIGTALIAVGIFFASLMSSNITRPLNNLTIAASSIANGDYTAVVPVDRRDEVGKLSRAFNAMAAQISRGKKALEKKYEETQHMNEHLRELSAHLENIREEERKHIAREMHDELGQFLTGLKMDIRWLDKRLPDSKENAASREKLTEMATMVDEAVLFVRKLAAELRPSILDDLGLIAALEWHSQEFSRRFNIEAEFRSEVPDLKTSSVVATGLFRMFQESLTNVARHASAKKVSAYLEVDGFIRLSIKDDGKGFDLNGIGDRKTLGLLGMKERAFMIGGKLEIISSPGQGTTIIIKVPLHQEEIAPN